MTAHRSIALLPAALLSVACSTPISTVGTPAADSNRIAETGAIVTLVKVKTPWYAPDALVANKMRDEIPTYKNLTGLAYKYFTLGDDGTYGGLYLWGNRAAAQSWFTDAWFAGVQDRRGTPADVRYFEAPVMVDNSPRVTVPNAGSAYATLVTLPIPQGLSRAALIGEFRKAMPTYAAIPGLARKYFILTPDGLFGGVYLWQNKQAADAFYSPEWHARAQATYKTDARIERFSVPIALKTEAGDSLLPKE
jgi:hypothetical protein